MLTVYDRVQMSVTGTPGTGDIVLNAAQANMQAVPAAADGKILPGFITDGSNWEVGNYPYTHSSKTLTRSGSFLASSSGSAISLTSAAIFNCSMPAAVLQGYEQEALTYIAGLVVTKGSGNTINISAGSCYDPASNRIISYAGGTNLVLATYGGAVGVSQHHQVYLKDVSGTATPVIASNANPLSTCYAGTAKGDTTNGRWIGWFLTDASSNIIDFQVVESAKGQLTATPLVANNAAPHRIINNQSSTTYTQTGVSQVPGPLYATTEASIKILVKFSTINAGGFAPINTYFSVNGTDNIDAAVIGLTANNAFIGGTARISLPPSSAKPYYKIAAGTENAASTPTMYADVAAIKVVR